MLELPRRRKADRVSTMIRRQTDRRRFLRLTPLIEGLEDRLVLSTVTWDSTNHPTGGSWDTGSNWIGGVVPSSTQDAVIDLTGSGTVTLSTGVADTVNSLTTNANTSIAIGSDTLSLATASSIGGNLSQTGGTLTGAGVLTVTGATTWTGGTMAGTGTTNANGGLKIGDTAPNINYIVDLARTLNNSGTAQIVRSSTGGGLATTLAIDNGGTFDNMPGASLAFTDDGINVSFLNSGGGVFLNEGTLTKAGTTGTSSIGGTPGGPTFNDVGAGTVSVNGGTLQLNSGATISASTPLAVAAGATVDFRQGTYAIAASSGIAGAGAVRFTGGTVNDAGSYNITTSTTVSGGTANLTGTVTTLGNAVTISAGTLNVNGTGPALSTPTLAISGGVLTGGESLTVTGATTWTGGTMAGTGVTNASGGLTIGDTAPNINYIVDLARTLNNPGTTQIVRSSTGGGLATTLAIDNGGTFDNMPGASLAFTDDGINVSFLNSGGGVFLNEGTLTKAGTTGTSSIGGTPGGPTFNDVGAGTVSVNGGTLQLNSGATISANTPLAVAAGATVDFRQGTYAIAASSGIAGAGAVRFTGGTVNDAGSYNITTSTTVSGGTANLTGTVTTLGNAVTISAGTLNVNGTGPALSTSTLAISGGVLTGGESLTVTGATTWTGGTMAGTGTTNASGGLTIGDTAPNINYVVDLARTLNNPGTAQIVRSSTGGGLATTLAIDNGGTFDNMPGASFALTDDGTNVSFLNSGGGVFLNEGTLTKAGSSGSSIFGGTPGGPTFNDVGAGTVSVNGGTLQLNSGATISANTPLAVAAGATVDFHQGTYAIAASSGIAGAGAARFTGGTVNDAGSYNITTSTTVSGGTANLTGTVTTLGNAVTISAGTLNVNGTGPALSTSTLAISGGTLTGSESLTVTGATTWTGGTMAGTGTTNASGGLTIGDTAPNINYIVDLARTLNNPGTAQIVRSSTGGGLATTLAIDNGGTFDNMPGASFALTDDGINVSFLNSGGGVFLNEGTLTKAGTTGTSSIGTGITFNDTGSVAVNGGTFRLDGGGMVSGTASVATGAAIDLHAGTYNVGSGLSISGAGMVMVTGATVNIPTGTATVGTGVSYNQTSGTTNLNGGTLVLTSSPLTLGGGLLESSGMGAIQGDVDNAGGVVAPGGTGTAGVFTIQGNYTQAAAGSLNVELGGLAAGTQYDQLNVTGTATLGGTLIVAAIHGFAPGTGAAFQVLNDSSHSGQFATIMPQGFPGGTNLTADYNANNLTLTTPAAALVSIAVTPANPSVAKGLTEQLTATGTLSDGTTEDLTSSVTWTSSNTSVATISPTGLASGLSVGSTTVTATSGAITSATRTLMVGAAALVSIAVTPANPSVAKGLTEQLTATGTLNDGTTEDLTSSVTWTSSNTSVATISPTGLASGLSVGSTTVTATSGAITSATRTLMVGAATLASIAVAPTNPSVAKGLTEQLTATGTLSDGTTEDLTSSVTWTSSNTSVATISPTGLASGLSVGSTTVTATSGAITSATRTLMVGAATLASIAVAPANPSVAKGLTQQFTATGTFSDGTMHDITGSVTWVSSNTAAATIGTTGLASGLGVGTTMISATSGAISSTTSTLTVGAAILSSIAVGPSNPSIAKGLTDQFTATGTFSDGTTEDLTGSVTWASSNTATATISATGLASGLGLGTATISATSGAISSTTSALTVGAAILSSIAVGPSNPLVAKGLTQQFTATGTFSDGTTEDLTGSVTWASSNTAAATISASGLASALAAGMTTITATSGRISGTSTLTATATPTPTSSPAPTSPVTVTSFAAEKVKVSPKPHAPRALAFAVGFSGALDATAAQTLTAYTVFSGKIKKAHKVSTVLYNKLVPLTQAIYIPASDTVVLLPKGKRSLPKLEQLQVNVSVLTDPMSRPINNGKNFNATVTNTGLIISTRGQAAAGG